MATTPQKLCAPDEKKESSQHKLHNPLMQACWEGQLDMLKELLKKENVATLITEYGQDGYAPIHCAAYNNRILIIEHLLSEHVCKVDQPSEHSETALHIACQWQHTELARLLLRRGANRLAVTTRGNTPLHYAASTDCAELVEMLLLDVVVKAHIDEVNTAGQTAAEFAATLGCVNAVSVLRHHGANFQVKNHLGYTAVSVAEMLGNTRCHRIANEAEEPLPRPLPQHPWHREGFSSVSSLPAACGSNTPLSDIRSGQPASAIAPRRKRHTTSATPTSKFAGSTESDVSTPNRTRSVGSRRRKVKLNHGLHSRSTPSTPGSGNKSKSTTSLKHEESPAEDKDSKVSSLALGQDCLKEVRKELLDISTKWYDIGLELGLRTGFLESIQYKKQDATTSLREMLLHWLKTVDPPPTWEGLACALESCSVGELRLAEQLRKKYCKTEEAAAPSGNIRRKTVPLEHSLSSHSTPNIPGPGKTTTPESVKREDSPAEDRDSKEPESQQ